MEIKILSKEDVQDMISEALSTDMNNDLWCENNSLRMQIKDLQELALNLTSNVEQLKKIVGWSSGYDDNNYDVDKSLEIRIMDLEYITNTLN
jgi:hypothetical protein|tara:strand:- start:276 stop:551 length:276 start_codon:yes stop_codon:yes gene_type:complete